MLIKIKLFEIKNLKMIDKNMIETQWRTERDLNPRSPIKTCTLSRGVVSAAHPSVLKRSGIILILDLKAT